VVWRRREVEVEVVMWGVVCGGCGRGMQCGSADEDCVAVLHCGKGTRLWFASSSASRLSPYTRGKIEPISCVDMFDYAQ
jgi:hypothetical protein